ncbi:DUF4019 domain-containing protein [Paraburkholderia bryophila]|uniref:DUF4019 domain-containing protein n=1 Tax=Paraburkholderia bryophila TaxID=420952 RepID=UPI00234A546C|nr:DUF4019 domain-containing protein [Paraburkholderia bryophila]WCM22560.1 DUF4019 domain-containing protein [Paraburkholderia bryophila]
MTRLISPLRAIKFAAACAFAACYTLAAAEPGTSADELLADATRVLQQVDSGHYAEVWQGVAPFIQARTSQEQFVDSVRQSRQVLGTVSKRGWASVTRIRYTSVNGVPDGLYANVDFATTLASGKTMFEKVSFQLQNDGQWRLAGYSPRQSQDMGSDTSPVGKQ